MKKKSLIITVLLTTLLLLFACGAENQETQTDSNLQTDVESSESVLSVESIEESSTGADGSSSTDNSQENADLEKMANLADGSYQASAWSFGTTKPLTVNVEIKDNRIVSIEVVDSSDTDIILNTAIENLIPSMVDHQSVRIDNTSGATYSSNAIKLATTDTLKQALKAAGSDTEDLSAFQTKVEKSTVEEVIDTDVLVVGLGGSGMATATRLAEDLYVGYGEDASKVNILGIDKAAKYGGTSVTTSSPMTINPPSFVEQNGGEEYVNAEELKQDWMLYTEGDAKEWAIDYMMEQSGPTLDWLISQGFVFGEPVQGLSDPYLICSFYGGSLFYPKSIVQTYFDSMMDNYIANGGEYMLNVEATELIQDDQEKVIGVKAEASNGTQYTIYADYVVLATGGFAGNGKMQDEYLSNEYYNLAGGGAHNVYGMMQNDGKMIQDAINKGAGTYNIGMPPVSHIGGAYKIMHEFPVEIVQEATETSPEITQSLNDVPMMMAVAPNSLAVNRQGVRFTDETTLQAYGNWQSGAYYFTIWSDEQIQKIQNEGLSFDTIGIFINQGGWPSKQPIPEIREILDKGIDMDYIYKADTIEELAQLIEVDPSTLSETVTNYNQYVETRTNPIDGITKGDTVYDIGGNPIAGDYDTFERIDTEGPFYAIKGSPWIYSTTAALDIDENFQVLDTNQEPIEGLYAVGTDSLGVLFTEKKEYVTYGGADQGWAFTSGYILGEKIADQILED